MNTANTTNKNTASALRQLRLAICFLTHPSHSFTSSEIYDWFYQGKRSTCERNFQRDRKRLEQAGLHICATKQTANAEKHWVLTNSKESCSYTHKERIALSEILYTLVQAHVFPFEQQLAITCLKLNPSLLDKKPQTAPFSYSDDEKSQKLKKELYYAYINKQPCCVSYRNANGISYERVLNIFGFFNANGQQYFVAQDNEKTAEPPKTYRIDRIRKAKATTDKSTYCIPDTFCIHTYKKLPFQVGKTRYYAQFVASSDAKHTHKSTHITHACSNTQKAAKWAITQGYIPVQPACLCTEYKKLLNKAASVITTENSAQTKQKITNNKGRHKTFDLFEKLLVCISAITQKQNATSAQAIAQALAINSQEAFELFDLILAAATPTAISAPCIALGLDDVTEHDQIIKTEQTACITAPIETQDIQNITEALAYINVNKHEQEFFTQFFSNEKSDASTLCFSYTQQSTKTYRVQNAHLVYEDNRWYISAIDLAAQKEKRFCIDAIDELCWLASEQTQVQEVYPEKQKEIDLVCTNPQLLDELYWPHTRVVRTKEKMLGIKIVWHEKSLWLARRLIAYPDELFTNNKQLLTQVETEKEALQKALVVLETPRTDISS